MKIKVLKKPALNYAGRDSKSVLAYEDELGDIEEALMYGIDAVSDAVDNATHVASHAAGMYWNLISGQTSNWLSEGVGASVNETPQGGYELRVDTPVGHVELYLNPSATANSDSIKAGHSTSIGGVNFGTNMTIKSP